jgi:hypothetical protein
MAVGQGDCHQVTPAHPFKAHVDEVAASPPQQFSVALGGCRIGLEFGATATGHSVEIRVV